MEKLKNVYYGIVLYFCIDIIFSFLISIYTIFISSTGIHELFIPVGSFFICLLVLYFFFTQLKKKPVIKWWIFLGLIILGFIPDTFYIYSWEEKHCLENVALLSNIVRIIYIVLLMVICYRGYVNAIRKKTFSLLFVYYGVLIALFSIIIISFYKAAFYTLYKYFSVDPIIVGVISVCISIAGIYLFFRSINKMPVIRSYYLFIAVILFLATEKIYYLNVSNPYSLNDLSLVWSMVFTVGTLIILTIKMTSYVRYYQLGKEAFPVGVDFFKINVKSVLIIIFLIVLNLAIFQGSQVLYSYRDQNQINKETIMNF